MPVYNTICTDISSAGNVQTSVEALTPDAWDKAIQVVRVTQDINGQLIWPENTETGVDRVCNILDIQNFTISGSAGVPAIDYRDTETPLFIRGTGLISSAASINFSASGTGDATVTSATQGNGSTGTVVIDVENADLVYPARDNFVSLISTRNGPNSGAMISNAYAYYPDYYVGPVIPPAISASNPSGWTPSASFRTFQTQLQRDIAGATGNSFGSSSAFGDGSNIGSNRLILRITHNGVTVDLVNNSSTPGTFSSGSGTVSLTNTSTSYGGQGGQVPIPGGTIQSRTITWTVNPSGGSSFNIVARYATRANQDASTTNYDSAWYFGLGNVTTPLPANSMMRLPASGTYSNNRSFAVTNNNNIPITFTAGVSPNTTVETVPANGSNTITNPGTSEGWSFAGSAPSATSFRFPASGNQDGSRTVTAITDYDGNGDTIVTVNNTGAYTYDTPGETHNFGFNNTTRQLTLPGERIVLNGSELSGTVSNANALALIGSTAQNLVSVQRTSGQFAGTVTGPFTFNNNHNGYVVASQFIQSSQSGADVTSFSVQLVYSGTTGAFFQRHSINRFDRDQSVDLGTTYGNGWSGGGFTGSLTVGAVRISNLTVRRNGTRYTTTNNNSVSITINRANGSNFTVPSGTSNQVNNFNDQVTQWNLTGTLGSQTSGGDPLANTASFVDNAAVDLDSNGAVTRGINLTDFNGRYARTGG